MDNEALDQLVKKRKKQAPGRKPGWYPVGDGSKSLYWNGTAWEKGARRTESNPLFVPAVITTVLVPIVFGVFVWPIVFIIRRQYRDAFIIWVIGSIWAAILLATLL